MLKITRTITTSLVLMGAALVAAPASSEARFRLGSPMAMLPADSEVAIGLKLDPAGDANSLLNYIPRAELSEYIREEWEKEGGEIPEIDSPATAGMMFAFHPDLLEKMSMLSIGLRGVQPAEDAQPDMYMVLGGSFTADEINAVAANLGGTPPTEEAPGSFSNADGDTKTYFQTPRDGILLLSLQQDWLGQAMGHLQQRTGLASDASSFRNLVPAIDNRDPDLYLFLSQSTVRSIFQQQPELSMFAAPLMQTRAIGLGVFPAAEPTLETVFAFADENGANTATMFLNALLDMGKQQAPAMIMQGIDQNDPEQVATARQGIEAIQKLQVTTKNNISSLSIPITRENLGDPAEARKRIMELVRQNAANNFIDMGTAPLPPPGSGAPSW